MDIVELVDKCKDIANKQGFTVTWDNTPVYLMLVVTELAEAMEAYRDNNTELFKEEIADTLIRLFHMIGDLGMKECIPDVINIKLEYNKARPYKHGRIVV